MNQDEAVTLLQRVACRDNRKPSAAMLATWSVAMDDVALPDAIEAVNLLDKTTTEFLMPKHVRDAVKVVLEKRTRGDRLARQIGTVRAIETSVEANRNARLNRIAACKGCDDAGRLPDGRFCSHEVNH